MRALVSAALIALWATTAAAASDVSKINCNFVTTCDQDGACAVAADRRVTFTLEPVKIEHHGEGEYVVRYDQISAKMKMDIYPVRMIWTEGESDVQTLTGLGKTAMIWHQFQYSGEDAASLVHFLNCEDAA